MLSRFTKSKFFIISLTLLVTLVGVAAFFYIHKIKLGTAKIISPKVTTATPTKDFDYEVDYTPTGFQPNILKINLGQKVAFKNLTNIPMWPASDPHPTHTDYPQFDADYDYSNNGTYIFQFERLGTFGYHNHEKSIDRGFIEVVDPQNPLPDIDKTKQAQRVMRDKFMAILKPGDPTSVYKLMNAITKN